MEKTRVGQHMLPVVIAINKVSFLFVWQRT